MKVMRRDFLTPDQCQEVVNVVDWLRYEWKLRPPGSFYTLGATTYLDAMDEYPDIAREMNENLIDSFGRLYDDIDKFFEDFIGLPVVRPDGVSLPGFHIIDHLANGVTGSLHIDEPFKRIDWQGSKIAAPFSFTVLLEEPDIGAGLNVWHGITGDRQAECEAWPEGAYLHSYNVGEMVIHTGLDYHQMANLGDMKEGERRVTLQGHGVILDDRSVVLYF